MYFDTLQCKRKSTAICLLWQCEAPAIKRNLYGSLFCFEVQWSNGIFWFISSSLMPNTWRSVSLRNLYISEASWPTGMYTLLPIIFPLNDIPSSFWITSKQNFLHTIPQLLLALSTGTITNLSWRYWIYLITSGLFSICDEGNLLSSCFNISLISWRMSFFQW